MVRLPLPLPIMLAVAVPLIFGGLTLPLAYGFGYGSQQPSVSQVWPAPASAPAWAGYEVVGMDVWSGAFSNARVDGYLLTLRCCDNPKRRLERNYWPGPEWDGRVEWKQDGVTYFPSKHIPKSDPETFTLDEAKRLKCE